MLIKCVFVSDSLAKQDGVFYFHPEAQTHKSKFYLCSRYSESIISNYQSVGFDSQGVDEGADHVGDDGTGKRDLDGK